MNKLFFSIFPLFLVLLFSSCFLPQPERPKEDYLIKVVGYNLPSIIKNGSVYQIPVRVYLGDTSINWSICLVSFRSSAFKVTGDRCISKEYDSELYEVYLPKEGFIILENPEIVLSETENIVVNACYNYYNIFSLEGCVSKDKTCKLKLTNVLPKVIYINMESAEVVYDPQNDTYYLRVYLYPSEEENVFIGSKDRDISKCYIESFSGEYYNVSYILKYSENSTFGNIVLYPGKINQIEFNIAELGIDRDLPIAYFELRINYTVLQRIYLGSVKIEK